MDTGRRQFLKTAGGITVGVLTVSGFSGLLSSCSSKEELDYMAVPWQYVQLDPVAAAERAYEAYYNGGCMYGAFEGIIGELRQSVGSPYDKFPAAMMKYGAAGVAGWGTLCGTCNGAAAAISLVHDPATRNKVINELFGWYGQEALPDYRPRNPKYDNIVASVADSQLCHVSVTKWCEASGFKATSPERAERCAWLTAATAKRAVELLNSSAANTLTPAYGVPESVTGCLSCHGKGGIVENVHASIQTTCTDCHSGLSPKHPGR